MTAITLHELTPERNWHGTRKPDWYEPRCRLYTGITLTRDGHAYEGLLTHFDGRATTAYLTDGGLDVSEHGPRLLSREGDTACHRRLVREIFETRNMEVSFA